MAKPWKSRKPIAKKINQDSGVFRVRTIPLIFSVIDVWDVWPGPSSDTGGWYGVLPASDILSLDKLRIRVIDTR